MKVAALYSEDGRVVTGCNHGEAFGKLSTQEQEGCLTSGFLDMNTGQFTSNEFDCVVKKFVLMRHGHIHDLNQNDPQIDEIGRTQVMNTANFILNELTIEEYAIYCSPAKRCVQSAEILSKICNLPFLIKNELGSIENETPNSFYNRVDFIIKNAPAKSILISHHNFIIQLVQMASGQLISSNIIPYASLTLVNNRNIVWFAKNV